MQYNLAKVSWYISILGEQRGIIHQNSFKVHVTSSVFMGSRDKLRALSSGVGEDLAVLVIDIIEVI